MVFKVNNLIEDVFFLAILLTQIFLKIFFIAVKLVGDIFILLEYSAKVLYVAPFEIKIRVDCGVVDGALIF